MRCSFCHSKTHASSACYQNPANRSRRLKFISYRVQSSASNERKLIVVTLDPNDVEHALEQMNEVERLLESTFDAVERLDCTEELHTFSSLGKLQKAISFWKNERAAEERKVTSKFATA